MEVKKFTSVDAIRIRLQFRLLEYLTVITAWAAELSTGTGKNTRVALAWPLNALASLIVNGNINLQKTLADLVLTIYNRLI